jgi:23S rRNA (cytidine1920-2'-O)/16S rRNA (cytidine1409-2'-O)-methyltransferase
MARTGLRRRLDVELVRRGLARSRADAAELVASRKVLVQGALAERPARLTASSEAISVLAPRRFVGRGGEKLDGALDELPVEVAGRSAIDVGSSTGGFTDCLLQRGARSVVAVDVGRHQLHERLRADPRVVVLEETDARTLELDALGLEPAELGVVDVSFTSVLPLVAALCGRLVEPGGDLVVLVKPEFEVGRQEAAKAKGVVRSPEQWEATLCSVGEAFLARGSLLLGGAPSRLAGREGNREFFLHFAVPGGPPRAPSPVELGVLARSLARAAAPIGVGGGCG